VSDALPERVCVLGGTGLLGAEVAAQFRDAGSKVVIVARHPFAPGRAIEGCEAIEGDAANAELLAEVVEQVDHVVYAIGSSNPSESNLDPPADVARTLPPFVQLLESLRRRPGTRLTFFSSGGTVYGEPAKLPVSEDTTCRPITSYGVTKLCAENYIGMYRRLYGLRANILRVSNAYGARQRAERGQGAIGAFLNAVRSGETIRIFGDGSVVRDYVYVGDIAKAAVALARLATEPCLVNVGTGTGHSLREVLDVVRATTGYDPVVQFGKPRPYDVRSIVLDVSRLASLIEWHPMALEDGVAVTWERSERRWEVAGR
jgi:UDP-glucose 4-epimerase